MPSSSSNCGVSVANNYQAQTKSVVFLQNSSKKQVEKGFKKIGKESLGDIFCKVKILKSSIEFSCCKNGTANV